VPVLRISGNLSQQVVRFNDVAARNIDKVVQDVSARIVTEISNRNHIWTGRMIGNWNIGINGADMTYDENRKDTSRSAMKARNLPETKRAKMGDRVYITNATPYAIYEEFGVPSRNRPGHPVIRGVAADIPLYVREIVAKVRSNG
jgi:hypothetical protein